MKPFISFDPRAKMSLALACTVLFFQFSSRLYSWGGAILMTLLFINEKRWRGAVKVALWFSILALLDRIILPRYMSSWFILDFLVHMVRIMSVPFIGYNWVITSTPISHFITALHKMHFPDIVIIPLVVLFRYFPALREDWSHVKSSMKMRNLGGWQWLKKPALTYEYSLIPLLASASTIGDELAAAAYTRGVSLKGKKTQWVELTMKIHDWLFIAFVICSGVLILWN